jgi:uncharacterized protein (DUF1501 family)
MTAPDPCTCDTGAHARRGMTRRTLLRRSAGVAAAASVGGLLGPALTTHVAWADTGYTGDTLVVLSLRGGFDGMSAVAPVGDPLYASLRPTIGLPASLTTPLSPVFGLHPALAPLMPLWNAGQLAVLQAVGQPSGTHSHFQATAELEKAAPDSTLRTGWLNRVLGTRGTLTPFSGVAMGATSLPQSLVGAPATSMTSIDSFGLSVWSGYEPHFSTALSSAWGAVPSGASTQVVGALQALGTTAAMTAAGYTPANSVTYPTSPLGKALRDVARLVRNEAVRPQVVTLDYGNWDMHVGLGRPGDTGGWLHRQLSDLAACLVAFATDLGDLLGRVSLVTLSEFGRRVAENGTGGVDHGHGNAMFVLGGGIAGGKVYGGWNGLAPAALDAGDLPRTTDYRDVLGELLVKRCRVGSLSTVFPGLAYTPQGLARQA